MTDFQPTPQTPEQVDQGLRDAFIQVNCLSCGKMWVGKSRLGETTYNEVDK
jgi:hypothetical protein